MIIVRCITLLLVSLLLPSLKSQCSDGTVLIDSKCAPCPQNCRTCSDSGVCNDCIEGILESGQCLYCSFNCSLRTTCGTIPTNCNACESYLQLSSTSPKKCITRTSCPIQKCQTCVQKVTGDANAGLTCSSCTNLYFAYNGQCNVCPFPCSACAFNIDTLFTSTIGPFLDAQLAIAYPSSGAQDYTSYTFYQKQSMLEIYALYQIVTTANSALSTSFNNLLKTDLIFTAVNTIDPKRLSNAQKAAYLNLITSGVYSQTTAPAKLMNQIRANRAIVPCSACFTGYYLNSDQCLPCSEACTSCTDASTCTQCQSGYALVSSACQKCEPPCLTCSGSKTTCNSCIRPYFLGGSNNCQLCQASNCITCSTDATRCLTCSRPFSLNPNTTGACYRCNQQTCLHCNPSNISECVDCLSGFFVNSSKKCQACPNKCTYCLVQSSKTVCKACEKGYVLIDGICNACGRGCEVCSPFDRNVCSKCAPKMYINVDNACSRCIEGCESCQNNNGLCNKLSPGYFLSNNLISRCGMKGCKICSPSNPTVCLFCLDGHRLDAGVCIKCGQFCQKCTSSACTLCSPNTILTSGNCQMCQGNCLTCESSNKTACTTCKKGYRLNQTSKLCSSFCSRGCVQCSGASTACTKCDKGYALKSDGTCIRCLSSCSGSCNPNIISQCISCDNGFEMKNNKCQRCSAGCLTCLDSQCTSCADGYALIQSGSSFICRLNCNFPCQTCNENNCLSCATGYLLESGICKFDPASCSPSCDTCPAGSYSNSGQCTRCPTTGCNICPGGVCQVCFDGYYFTANSCTKCPSNCKTCIDGTACVLCAPGYIQQVISVGDDISTASVSPACTACSSNCKSCSLDANKCESCNDGFRIRERKCFGRNNVGFKFKFNTDYSQFISQGLTQSLIANLAKILNKPQNQISITSVTNGSTSVDGSISADSNTNAAALANQLYDSVISNNNALGFPLLSSSVVSYYDDTVQYDPKSRSYLGAIIGCSIAAGVIIIIVLIVFCCIRNKKRKYKEAERKQKELQHHYFQKQQQQYSYQIPAYQSTIHKLQTPYYPE